ncbi:RNA recognition motif-containing protein [Phlyctema vagabunda]|uniref:RNA recognition motif-containing protein n=1 Tax=Phlyctema vagabunda TaxID=108571 RepID=A0ABR4PDG0_9HELO
MAVRPGEDLAATLFADIHYFYGSPTAKPPHHRFDKGSYVYLFENPAQRRARVEVANHAGTPDQDAFDGHLDGTQVHYSYKHSSLVTVIVDGAQNGQSSADTNEWHLPTFDPRNETKYHYKLHTIDIYFWSKEDALQFVNGIRRVLPPQQLTIADEPAAPAPHADAMSPVVQQLENVAITDPSYSHGRTRDSRTTSNFPGPPTSTTPPDLTVSTAFPGPPISATPRSHEAANFAPLAYNPAAPAAPEAIRHREKTPPPEDGAPNPLMAAAASDQGQRYGTPFHQPGLSSPPPQQSYFPGPPTAGLQSPFSQPPPSAGFHSPYSQPQTQQHPTAFAHPSRSSPSSFGQPPINHSQHSISGVPANQPSGQVPVNQYANYPGSPGFTSPMNSPGLSSPGIYSPGLPPPPSAVPQIGSPPPGGFSNYTYNPNNSLSNTQPLANDYSVHQQVYRPTEGEMVGRYKEKVQPSGKLESKASNVEKRVGGFLKKLEKKYG